MPKTKELKQAFIIFVSIVLTLGLSISLQSVLAVWSPPIDDAPEDNPPPPIFNDGEDPNVPVVDKPLTVNDNFYVGNDKLVVDYTNSSVGIGKAPDTGIELDVVGDINFSGIITGDGSGLTGIAGDNLGSHTAAENIILNGHWLSGDGGDEGAYVNSDGNVGIGTNNPGQKLEVNGNIRTTPNNIQPHLVLDSTGSGDNWTSQGAYISLGESGDLGSAALHLTYRGDGYGWIGSGAVTNAVPAYSYLRFDYNSKDIYTDSNIGINDTTPDADLDVNGTIHANTLCDESGLHCQDLSDGPCCEDDCGSAWADSARKGINVLCEYGSYMFKCKSNQTYIMYYNVTNWDIQCSAGSNCWVRNHPSGSWHNGVIRGYCMSCP